MGRPGPETQAKRQREQAKAEKRRIKAEKKALRKASPVDADTEEGGNESVASTLPKIDE